MAWYNFVFFIYQIGVPKLYDCILGLTNVDPPEGRLEFLAYLINQDRQNESLQV